MIYYDIQLYITYMNFIKLFSYSTRHRVFNSLVGLCESCGLPSSSEHSLLSLSSYPSFMLGEVRRGLGICYHGMIAVPPPTPSSSLPSTTSLWRGYPRTPQASRTLALSPTPIPVCGRWWWTLWEWLNSG